MGKAWSSLAREYEGSYRPNITTILVKVLHTLSLLFRNFMNASAEQLGPYALSSPSIIELRG